MSEYKPKPKGKPLGRRALLFLLAGVGIGVLVTGGIVAFGVAFLMPVQVVSVTAPPVAAQPTLVPLPTATPFPAGAQAVGTVVANQINTAAVSPDGSMVAASVNEGGTTAIYLSSIQDGTTFTNERNQIYLQSSYVTRLQFSPDGAWLTAIEDERTMLFFDVRSGGFERFEGISAMAFSADSTHMVLAHSNLGLQWYDIASQRVQQTSPQIDETVIVLDISSQGKIAVLSRNFQGASTIWLYDSADFSAEPRTLEQSALPFFTLDFHPDGNWLAVGGLETASALHISGDGRAFYELSAENIYDVAFSHDGTQLAFAGGSSGTGTPFLQVVRWDDGQPIPPDPAYYEPLQLTGHGHAVFDVAFTPGGHLLSASWDGTVRLWDVENGDQIGVLGF